MPKEAAEPAEWILLAGRDGLTYRKEAIYQGDWGKLNPSGDGVEFSTYRDALKHWERSAKQFRERGIAIPLSRSHDNWQDTEEKLGDVIGATVAKNKKGLSSLFLDVRFADAKSRDIALKGDVSIGSPPAWYDGAKRKYEYPLQHVASTAAPVIPGLETWQAIAAAFNKSTKGNQMDLDDLIAMLGIEVDESVNTDEAKKALVMAKLKELVGAPAPEGEGGDPPAPVDASQGKATPAPVSQGGVPQAKKVTVAFSHLQVKQVRKGRQAELDGYVAQGKLSAATAKDIALAHCKDEAIGLELSQNGDGEAFDREVAIALSATKNRPLAKSGRTEAGDDSDDAVIELSHGSTGGSLVKNMEKLAAASR